MRLRRDLACYLVGDDQVVLIGEREHYLLRGRLYRDLLFSLADERRTEEALSSVQAEHPPYEVMYGLERLRQRGYLEEEKAAEPRAEAATARCCFEEVSASARPARGRVAIAALSGLDGGPLRRALASTGVSEAAEGERPHLLVVLVGDYLCPELQALHGRMRRAGLPWLLFKPVGCLPLLGPIFQPDGRPCYACLWHRLRSNQPVEVWLQRRLGLDDLPRPPLQCDAQAEEATLLRGAALIARFLDGEESALADNLFALPLDESTVVKHRVARRSRCPECGDPGLPAVGDGQAPCLRSRLRRLDTEGGHRIEPPSRTYERLASLVSPITGILSSLGPIPSRDHPRRPVWGASYLVTPSDEIPTFDAFHRTTLGKGCSAEQAQASALCEGIERWSAQFTGEEPRIRSTLAELGERAISPTSLLLWSEAQYARACDGISTESPVLQVPRRCPPDRALDFSQVLSLTDGTPRLVPTQFCFAQMPLPPEERVCPYHSNGDAAGNCLEEAILQGLLELIERDAAAIWWYNRLVRPSVDIRGQGHPYLDDVASHYAELGFELFVLDVTTDLDIPAYVAYAESPSGQFSIGFGCHLEARLAVERAVTECNQIFDPTGTRPLPWSLGQITDPSYLRPDPAARPRTLEDLPSLASPFIDDEIRLLVDRCQAAGLEVLVLDRTRPDVALSVVKVIVPGLRTFWPRLAPGRLYDVPVRMGWLEQPLTEEELNPVPLLL